MLWSILPIAALVLAGSVGISLAQQRNSQAPSTNTTTGDRPANPSVPTDRRFTSTLTFEARPADARPVPLPFRAGLEWNTLGFPILWRWDPVMLPRVHSGAALGLSPENAPIGGLQLDVQPWRAQVYVDGAYAGLVGEFTGYYHHLDLVAGSHLIAIVAPDYQPLVIDVIVSPGHTTTYRGTLMRTLDR